MAGPVTIALTLNTAWNIHNFRMGLAKSLVAEGYKVLAIAPEDGFAPKIQDEGIPFIPLRKLSRKGTNPIADILLLNELKSIYKQHRVDVALQYTIKPVIYGSLAARGTQTQTINTITGLGYSFLSNGWVNKLVKRLYRVSLKSATHNYFQNRDDRELFLKGNLVDANHSSIIHGSGINTSHFSCPETSKQADAPVHFLFIGRLLYDKGVAELFEATRCVGRVLGDKVSFEVVGALDEGNPSAISRTELEAWERHPQCKYSGVVNDPRPYIRNADVVVLPSYREGVPRVMLEGMSMERALIATDVPGCRETIIHGENGLLVKPRDVQDLSDAMIKITQLTPEQRKAMGQRGRELALERFDEKVIIQEYLRLIKYLKS